MALTQLFNFTKSKKKKVFIVGTGRSGTHLLARTLGSAKEVDAHIESNKYFKLLTNAAIHKNTNDRQSLVKLIREYDSFMNQSKKRIVLDKTHPNLWLIDEINSEISNSYFVGIKRNLYATVNSMLRHEGVLKWYTTLDLDVPNDFLGINELNMHYFKDLPLEAKCALRWKSHQQKLEEVVVKYENFILVDYEDFYNDIGSVLRKINDFVDEDLFYTVEKLNQGGDIKWQQQLSAEQIKNIDAVVKEI